VLVVDDEVIVAKVLQRGLAAEHDVVCVHAAREALERIRGGDRFDVILCDLMMPEMTGIDLHHELSAIGLADRMIFLTGGAFTSAARQFLDGVPNARLEKPFDLQQVRALVNARVR